MSAGAIVPAASVGAATWHDVGSIADVPLFEGRVAVVDGARVAVFRTADGLFALDAACPHAGGPLSDGIVAGGCVTCPLHGWRFDLRTGACADKPGVAAHDVEEREGRILVRLAAALPHAA